MRLFASLAHWFPRLLVLGLLASCGTKSDGGVTRCAGDRTCPQDFVCADDGNCYAKGTVPRGADGAAGRDVGSGGASASTGGAGGSAGKGGAGGDTGSGGGGGGSGGSQTDAPGETDAGAMMADTGASDRAPPPASCAEFANAWCSKKASCEPLDLPFASAADCREGMDRYCTSTFLDQPDSGWTPAAAGILCRRDATTRVFRMARAQRFAQV